VKSARAASAHAEGDAAPDTAASRSKGRSSTNADGTSLAAPERSVGERAGGLAPDERLGLHGEVVGPAHRVTARSPFTSGTRLAHCSSSDE